MLSVVRLNQVIYRHFPPLLFKLHIASGVLFLLSLLLMCLELDHTPGWNPLMTSYNDRLSPKYFMVSECVCNPGHHSCPLTHFCSSKKGNDRMHIKIFPVNRSLNELKLERTHMFAFKHGIGPTFSWRVPYYFCCKRCSQCSAFDKGNFPPCSPSPIVYIKLIALF